MTLGEREQVNETHTNIITGDTLYTGVRQHPKTGEPAEVTIAIEFGPGLIVAVSCDPAKAREVAATLVESADELEADNG